jgi:fumarate reductase subunit C
VHLGAVWYGYNIFMINRVAMYYVGVLDSSIVVYINGFLLYVLLYKTIMFFSSAPSVTKLA